MEQDMNEKYIRKLIVDIIIEEFGEDIKEIDVELITHMDLIEDLGMTSVVFISIVVRIEEALNIIVPDEMLLLNNFKNVNSIISMLIKLDAVEIK